MRGNRSIDYDQLGLKYFLESFEVLFNLGISYIASKKPKAGQIQLERSSEFDFDIDCLKQRHVMSRTQSILAPPMELFTPNLTKIKNIDQVDYLGDARVIASIDVSEIYQLSQLEHNKQN